MDAVPVDVIQIDTVICEVHALRTGHWRRLGLGSQKPQIQFHTNFVWNPIVPGPNGKPKSKPNKAKKQP